MAVAKHNFDSGDDAHVLLRKRNASQAAPTPSKRLRPNTAEVPLSEPASLCSLPDEVIEKIGKLLNAQDIAACRLAGRDLRRAMFYSFPFETMSVMLSYKDSLARALTALQDDGIASRVRKLHLNMEELQSNYRFDHVTGTTRERHGKARAEQYEDSFHTLLRKQIRLRGSQGDLRALARILTRLRALSPSVEIILSDTAHCHNHFQCWSEFHRETDDIPEDPTIFNDQDCGWCTSLESQALDCPRCSELRPYCYTRLTEQLGRPLHVIARPHNTRGKLHEHPIAVLFRALVMSGLQPTGIRAESQASGAWHLLLSHFLLPSPLAERLHFSFQDLRSLRLQLFDICLDYRKDHASRYVPVGYEGAISAFSGLLRSAAPTLQLLAICVRDRALNDDWAEAYMFKECIQPHTFPRLRTLALRHMSIDASGLRDFVHRHRTNLSRISMPMGALLIDASFTEHGVAYAGMAHEWRFVGDAAEAVSMRSSLGLTVPGLQWDKDDDVDGVE